MSMMAGFIHFDCLCGLDIYYFGNSASGDVPIEAIESFRSDLSNQRHAHAIYSSRDEAVVSCPQCDSLIQLPTPEIVAFLAQKSLETINSEGNSPKGLPEEYYPANHADGYSRPLTELN